MSIWIAAAMVLNAALVAAVIGLALRIGRGAVDTVPTAELPPPIAERRPERRLQPHFSRVQMTGTEWRALFDAFREANRAYQRELAAWHTERPRTYGNLTRARHEVEVAKRRLTRFERQMTAGQAAYR